MNHFVSRLSDFRYFLVDCESIETSMLSRCRASCPLAGLRSGQYFSRSAHEAEHDCEVQRAAYGLRCLSCLVPVFLALHEPDSSTKSIVMLMISCIGFGTVRARSHGTWDDANSCYRSEDNVSHSASIRGATAGTYSCVSLLVSDPEVDWPRTPQSRD